MEAVGTWVGIAGLAVAIAAGLGAAIGIFRANMAKATIDTQRDRIEALEGQVRDEQTAQQRCELKIAAQETRLAEQDTRIAEQQGEIQILRSVITGEAALENIAAQLTQHHDQAMARLAALGDKLGVALDGT